MIKIVNNSQQLAIVASLTMFGFKIYKNKHKTNESFYICRKKRLIFEIHPGLILLWKSGTQQKTLALDMATIIKIIEEEI